MKFSELSVGTEYAIVPNWTYNNRSARDVDTCRENDVVKGKLISLTKYEYEPSNRKSDPNNFTPAQQGNKSVGVLVEAVDSTGRTIYWTTRLADIVAPYSVLEPKWNAINAEQEAKEREAKLARQKLEDHRLKVQNEVARCRGSVETTAKELLGVGTYVSVDTEGYEFDMKGIVKLSLDEFQQLVELAYAGKEAYGE